MRRSLALMGAFWNNPMTTGSLVPSSPVLARALAEPIGIDPSTVVVELGAGSGAITRALFRHGLHQRQYLGVEVNPDLTTRLKLDFRGATFVQDSAVNLLAILRDYGIHRVSHVVASLPWTLIAPLAQMQILEAVAQVLRPGGRLLTFTYVPGRFLMRRSQHFHDGLRATFRTIDLRNVVWRNVPPALLWECSNA